MLESAIVPSKRDGLEYIQSMLTQLGEMARACDERMSVYLISMAIIEISDALDRAAGEAADPFTAMGLSKT